MFVVDVCDCVRIQCIYISALLVIIAGDATAAATDVTASGNHV